MYVLKLEEVLYHIFNLLIQCRCVNCSAGCDPRRRRGVASTIYISMQDFCEIYTCHFRYSYSPDCKVSARQICDQFEKRKVVPVCTEVRPLLMKGISQIVYRLTFLQDYRRQCDYSPKETCTEEPKHYCYKEEVREQEEICDKLQINAL